MINYFTKTKIKYVLIFVLFISAIRIENIHAQLMEGYVNVDGQDRTFTLYIPDVDEKASLPLVIVFHGHGGSGNQIMNSTGFNLLADNEKFAVVYPDGMNKSWNDGRREPSDNARFDDVKFINQMINKLAKTFHIDTTRIYAAGMSNGGIFCFYLASKLSSRILAIAPVAANIPENLLDDYEIESPVSLMLINGTSDKLIKYEGGDVGFSITKYRGTTVSTDESIETFVKLNKCPPVPDIEKMPDLDGEDGCVAIKYSYTGGLKNTQVILIKVFNGGHTWPGGTQYLPKLLVGNVCRDFSATEVIWNFFKSISPR